MNQKGLAELKVKGSGSILISDVLYVRSEERRVGKEC